MSYVKLSTQGNVSVVTLNRPERLNAIGSELLIDFHKAMVSAQNDPATTAILLAGAGRAFCAGDDLKEFDAQAESAATIAEHVDRIQQITRDIMYGEKLVVGAIHGYAVGGGFEWMLNCDLVVASDNLVCFFPEMALGHFVTGGVTHLLPQALGYQRAMELLVLGERHDAHSLHRMGLVNRVVAHDELMAKALEIAHQVASRSRGATSRLKRLITTQLGAQLASALELERQAATAAFADSDTAERVRAFTQKRL
jgi:enoyl-CoA hydratase/carnithine racemase